MKHLILTLFALVLSAGAYAQFHTIKPNSTRYRVNAVSSKSVSATVAKVPHEASSVSNGVSKDMFDNVDKYVEYDASGSFDVSASSSSNVSSDSSCADFSFSISDSFDTAASLCKELDIDNVKVLKHGKDDKRKSIPSATSVADGMLSDVFSSTKGKTEPFKADSVREALIRQYLAVAYPLRHIRVTSAFGMRRHPILNKRMRHNGIDLRARYEEVFSVLDGVVTAVGSDRLSGRYVSIRCMGGYSFSYCHLSQPLVKVGERVKAGEVIAISGNSGMSTGAHLHLGVHDASGQWLDPIVMLRFVQQTRNEVMQQLFSLQGLTEGDG